MSSAAEQAQVAWDAMMKSIVGARGAMVGTLHKQAVSDALRPLKPLDPRIAAEIMMLAASKTREAHEVKHEARRAEEILAHQTHCKDAILEFGELMSSWSVTKDEGASHLRGIAERSPRALPVLQALRALEIPPERRPMTLDVPVVKTLLSLVQGIEFNPARMSPTQQRVHSYLERISDAHKGSIECKDLIIFGDFKEKSCIQRRPDIKQFLAPRPEGLQSLKESVITAILEPWIKDPSIKNLSKNIDSLGCPGGLSKYLHRALRVDLEDICEQIAMDLDAPPLAEISEVNTEAVQEEGVTIPIQATS
jgi:hypothetical protein